MATYPSIPFTEGSEQQAIDSVLIDRTAAGTGRARALFTSAKKALRAVHRNISAADKDALQSFYNTNRATTNTVTWTDGQSYTVLLVSLRSEPHEGARWTVTLDMVEQ